MGTMSKVAKIGRKVLSIDSFAHGITISERKVAYDEDPRGIFSLQLMGAQRELGLFGRRYPVDRKTPAEELELHLMRLSKEGVLNRTEVFFGITKDPFHPFEGAFDPTMKLLELFQRYTPGMLHLQTRSPLVVLALPTFKRLGTRVAMTMGIETPDDEIAARYTPELPRVSERLNAVRALRRMGVEVNIQVGPVLPYGDWKKDANAFGQLLVDHADHLVIHPLFDGGRETERELKNTPLVRQLAMMRQFHWLRPDSAKPLLNAVDALAPEKLRTPARKHLTDRQLSIFAA